jgi:hypothetical protein
MSTETLKTIPTKRELEERWERLRSHKRGAASVRFVAEWEKGNKRLRANAITVDVSQSGCMAIVGADLPLHQRVRLIHPENGRSIEGQVVWRGHEAWDVGIAVDPADASFWGVKF